MACCITDYCKDKLQVEQGAVTDEGFGHWWLRDMVKIAKVDKNGNFMQNTGNEAGYVMGSLGLGPFRKGNGGPVFCDYLISVRPAVWIQLDESVSKLIPADKKLELNAGETKKANVEVQPENAAYKQLAWSSEDEEIATVDQDGRITGKKCGKTKINVSSTDGSDVKASFEVVIPAFTVSREEITFTTPDEINLKVTLNGISNDDVSVSARGDCFVCNDSLKSDRTISFYPRKQGKGSVTLSYKGDKKTIPVVVESEAITIFRYYLNMSENQENQFYKKVINSNSYNALYGMMILRGMYMDGSEVYDAINDGTAYGASLWLSSYHNLEVLGVVVGNRVTVLMYDTEKDDFRRISGSAGNAYGAQLLLEETLDSITPPNGSSSINNLDARDLKKYLNAAAEYAGWHY